MDKSLKKRNNWLYKGKIVMEIKKGKAIINNGTGLFPLAWIGSGMASKGRLTKLILAGYPTKSVTDIFFKVGIINNLFSRLLGRKLEISEDLIQTSWVAELFYQLAHLMRGKKGFGSVYQLVEYCSHLFIEWNAYREIKNIGTDTLVYHCRAGFGGISLKEAKKKNLVTICHHTLAHPLVLDYLINNRGGKPSRSVIEAAKNNLSMTWNKVLSDIDSADFVLIESEFQLETFKWVGFDVKKVVSINHPGIDPFFRALISDRQEVDVKQSPKILYAGSLNKRKGADELQELIEITSDIDAEINIAGLIDATSKQNYQRLLKNPRVNILGVLSRSELAETMGQHDILVLLSYAEGSPRSVLEAMGCGCVIFTTPNSGTPVKHLENGWVSEPGNLLQIEKNYRHMMSSRHLWHEMKVKNAELAIKYFTPEKYFGELETLYDRVSNQKEISL